MMRPMFLSAQYQAATTNWRLAGLQEAVEKNALAEVRHARIVRHFSSDGPGIQATTEMAPTTGIGCPKPNHNPHLAAGSRAQYRRPVERARTDAATDHRVSRSSTLRPPGSASN